jgi:ankyrin repeat protein
VKQLIAARANVNTTNQNGHTLLYEAVQSGQEDVVQQLILAEADVNKAGAKAGNAPLHLAIVEGHAGLVKQLIKARANVNTMDPYGHTPLYDAVLCGQENVVQQLIAVKADVNKVRASVSPQAPLHLAIMEGRTDLVEQLIGADADVNNMFDNKVSPVCLAIQHQKHGQNSGEMSSILELLIKAKSDVNKVCTGGILPLHVACFNLWPRAVNLLIQAAADVNVDVKNWKPLDICRTNNLSVGDNFNVVKSALEQAGAHGSLSTYALGRNHRPVPLDVLPEYYRGPEVSSSESNGLVVGNKVRLHGLQSDLGLNDKVGRIFKFDAEKKRYGVQLSNTGRQVSIKLSNLSHFALR